MNSLSVEFRILHNAGNEMPRKQLIEELSLSIDFEPWELERYEADNAVKIIKAHPNN